MQGHRCRVSCMWHVWGIWFNSYMWFILRLISTFRLVLVMFKERNWLYQLSPVSMFLSENCDKVHPPKHVIENRTVDNVRKSIMVQLSNLWISSRKKYESQTVRVPATAFVRWRYWCVTPFQCAWFPKLIEYSRYWGTSKKYQCSLTWRLKIWLSFPWLKDENWKANLAVVVDVILDI
jgi:hypothetical protein